MILTTIINEKCKDKKNNSSVETCGFLHFFLIPNSLKLLTFTLQFIKAAIQDKVLLKTRILLEVRNLLIGEIIQKLNNGNTYEEIASSMKISEDILRNDLKKFRISI